MTNRRAVALLAATLPIAAVVFATAAMAHDVTPVTVDIHHYAFAPDPITIDAGATVTWTNDDSVAHDATSDDGPAPFATGSIEAGGSSSVALTAAGTYHYTCSVHPDMVGTILVIDDEPRPPTMSAVVGTAPATTTIAATAPATAPTTSPTTSPTSSPSIDTYVVLAAIAALVVVYSLLALFTE